MFDSSDGMHAILGSPYYVAILHPTPCTLHPIPYTPHPTPYTLHPSPYTLHPTPCTLHPTPDTLHPIPYTLHPTPHTLHPTQVFDSSDEMHAILGSPYYRAEGAKDSFPPMRAGVSSSRLGPVDPSFRALSGRLKFAV